jgi:hypothetical protein
MSINNIERRLGVLESDNRSRLLQQVQPVFNRFTASLSPEDARYIGLTLTDKLPADQEDPALDWAIEAKLYRAFADLKVKVPGVILADLVVVEKELGLGPDDAASPLDRVNRVVAFLNGQLVGA